LIYIVLATATLGCAGTSGIEPEPPGDEGPGWAVTFGGSGGDMGRELAIDASGNVYFWGEFSDVVDVDPGPKEDYRTSNGGSDFILAKYSPAGGLLWARAWGGLLDEGSRAQTIALDAAANIYLAGNFSGNVDFDPGPGVDVHTSAGLRDTFVCKFDSDGIFLWALTWGGELDDSARGIAVYGMKYVYVAGAFKGTIDFDPGAGESERTANGTWDAFLSKFGTDGSFEWVRVWGTPGEDEAEDACMEVDVDGHGNAYITGLYQGKCDFDPGPEVNEHTALGIYDAFLSKFDPSGDLLWVRTWGGDSWDKGILIAVDIWNNIFVTGYFSTTVDFDPGPGVDEHVSHGDKDAFLVKYDESGNFKWARTWGAKAGDWGRGVAVDDWGDAFVTGGFAWSVDFDPGDTTVEKEPVGFMDCFACKYDGSGNFLWARTWGSTYSEMGRGVAVNRFGDAYFTGWFRGTVDFDPSQEVDARSSNGKYDVYILKLKPDGYW